MTYKIEYDQTDAAARILYAKRDPTDKFAYPILADSAGNIFTSTPLDMAKGSVPGHSCVQKFGEAPNFDTTDGYVSIWDGADKGAAWEQMTVSYSTSAVINSISSTAAGDNQPIQIQGLDSNYVLTVQTATLAGQAVVTFGTNLIRVFRMINTGVTDNAGHVFCFESGGVASGIPTASTIRAIIKPLNNQTLMSIYTIPAGKTGYLESFYSSISGASRTTNFTIRLRIRPFGGVFQLKHSTAIVETGSSSEHHNFHCPVKIEAKSDIAMYAIATGASITDCTVNAGFDIVLVDN